jgi:large subunit ribosomal protein L25
MAEYKLAGDVRTITGKKNRALRKQGLVPGVVYGPTDEPVSVQFAYREVEVTLMRAGGTNLIDIEVGGKTYPSLAREVQRDVVRGDILHVDFLAVDLSQKIRVDVPVIMEGRSPLVASREAILITGPSTLTLEVFPQDIRDRILVDLTPLDTMGAEILVKDLKFKEGVTVINEPNEMIAKVVQPAAARRAEADAMEAAEGEAKEGEAAAEE